MSPDKPTEPRSDRFGNLPCMMLLLTMVTATGMLVRWGMNPYFGFDESWHTAMAYMSPLWLAMLTASQDTHPFLPYLLIRPLFRLGVDPFVPRLWSIVPAILSLPLWYLLLRKLRINTSVALTTTVVLALSFAFQHVGVMTRSYSLTAFLMLAGLWFWSNLLPGTDGQASRRSTVMALGLFSAAFWCLYAAGFATAAIIGATVIIGLAGGKTGRQALAELRRNSGWPEWLLFALAHALGVAWFLLGRSHEANLGLLPGHVSQWVMAEGQAPLDYVITGLRQEMALLTPLIGKGKLTLDVGLGLLLAVIAWLSLHYARRGQVMQAVLALTPLLLTAVLALLGVIGRYPFGGELRHQYILLPFLLLLLPLGLNAIWGLLDNRWLRATAVALVIATALYTSHRGHQQFHYIGEPAPGGLWTEETPLLFEHATDTPVLLPRSIFYPIYVKLLKTGVGYNASWLCPRTGCTSAVQGWQAIISDWPDFEQFTAGTRDGGSVPLLRSKHWLFTPVPDKAFFVDLKNLMAVLDTQTLRLLSQTDPGDHAFEAELAAAATRHGLTLTEFLPTSGGVIWTVELSSTTPEAETANPP